MTFKHRRTTLKNLDDDYRDVIGQRFTQEREQLHRTISGLEGDFVTKLLIAFLGASIALSLFTLAVRLGPLVVSWVRGLF